MPIRRCARRRRRRPPPTCSRRHGALLTRSHLRELGLERRAIDAVFRALPVVALPGYSRPLIRAEEYHELVDEHTYRDDRVRPCSCLASGSSDARRPTGQARYVVKYRLGGRRERSPLRRLVRDQARGARPPRVGRRRARRDARPRPQARRSAPPPAPTLAEAAERWRASRVDVADVTASAIASSSARVLPLLGTRRVDEITPADIAELVAALHAAGRKRETIRKSVTVLAQVLDFAGIKDNPARDRVHVRLPREEREEPTPPTADQIEAVLPLMPRRLRARRARPRRHRHARRRARGEGPAAAATSTSRTPAGASAAPSRRAAAAAGSRSRPTCSPPCRDAPAPRRPRPGPARLPGVTQERLRIAIGRACKASGTPTWSPHDLRHRRISLWHRQGETWALIGARVGQRSLSVTADTYTHVLLDDRELGHPHLVDDLGTTPG